MIIARIIILASSSSGPEATDVVFLPASAALVRRVQAFETDR